MFISRYAIAVLYYSAPSAAFFLLPPSSYLLASRPLVVVDSITSHNPYPPADYIVIRAWFIIKVVMSGSGNGSARLLTPKKER